MRAWKKFTYMNPRLNSGDVRVNSGIYPSGPQIIFLLLPAIHHFLVRLPEGYQILSIVQGHYHRNGRR